MTLAWCVLAVAMAQRPDPAALNEAATRLVQEQNGAAAERAWKQAVEVSPEFFPATFNLGFFYFSRSRFDEAEPLLAKAARLEARNFRRGMYTG